PHRPLPKLRRSECYNPPMLLALFLLIALPATLNPPRDVHALIQQGEEQSRRGQFSDTIASYRAALKLWPHNLAAEVALAGAFRPVHNDDEARRLLEQSAREHPKSAEPLIALGDLEMQMQTYEEAVKHLSAAVALAPANIDARDRLGLAYKSKGDNAAALA